MTRVARLFRGGWAGLLLAALGAPGSTAADPRVDEAYGVYYSALAGFGQRDLERELAAAIDDALLSGSHAGRPSTAQKRRQIADGTLAGARDRLCASTGAEREACTQSVGEATRAAAVRFEPGAVGTVAAICARLLAVSPAPCPGR